MKYNSPPEDLAVTSTEATEELKCAAANKRHLNRTIKLRLQRPVRKEHVDAMKELLNKKEIILNKPGKGSGLVVMNTCDYIDKLIPVLSD